MAEDPDELIVISHPDIKANGVATRTQLDEVWSKQGFKEVKGGDPADPNPDSETSSGSPAASSSPVRTGGANG